MKPPRPIHLEALAASYDRLAAEYARRYRDELRHKPMDRALLERFVASVRPGGRVCDLGCGPGHVTRFLADRGVDVFGLDLSSAMVDVARSDNPDLDFRLGDLATLDEPSGSLAGLVAFYSLIHTPRRRVTATLAGWRRALAPKGRLLLAVHLGAGEEHLDEVWGEAVDVELVSFGLTEMAGYLVAAGFEVREAVERPPCPEVEYASQRGYLLAAAPGRRGDPGEGAG